MPRKNLTDKIILNRIYNARYVRLYIDIHTSNDPDGGIEYNTVSIYELEVYCGNLDEKMSMSDILNEFQVQTPNVGDKKLNVTLPEVEGYTVEYNGTDFGQVIDKDLTIYQPISDKKVKVSFKTTDIDTNDYKFKEVTVTVPGSEKNDETSNKAQIFYQNQPNGGHGKYTVSKDTKIFYKDSSLQRTAEALAKDYENIELALLDSHDTLHLLDDKSYVSTSFNIVGLNDDLPNIAVKLPALAVEI